jgi:copper chaperone CopZ
MTNTDFKVKGLTCNHCVMTVSRAAALVPGVTAVDIELVPNGESTLHLESAGVVDFGELDSAITESGYQLVRD